VHSFIEIQCIFRIVVECSWKEVVQKDCQARNLNKEDAMDRGRWKKLIKIG